MEEHRVRQARIVEALEEEKKKISRELEEMQKRREIRENQTPRHGESFSVIAELTFPLGLQMKMSSELYQAQYMD